MHSVYVSLEVNPPLHQRGVPVAPLTLIWKQKMAAQKNKEISSKDLVVIKPITDNQKVIFDTWKKGQNQFLFGAAGTGKTFVSLYLALQDVMDLKKPYDKVILVRSMSTYVTQVMKFLF